MTAEGPRAGLTHSRSLIVDPSVIVPRAAAPASPAHRHAAGLANACMVGFVEATCIDALKPFLQERQKTVGIHVGLSHVATPIGMRVTVQVELLAVEGRRLRFKVKCFHERAIIDPARFLARLKKKAAG